MKRFALLLALALAACDSSGNVGPTPSPRPTPLAPGETVVADNVTIIRSVTFEPVAGKPGCYHRVLSFRADASLTTYDTDSNGTNAVEHVASGHGSTVGAAVADVMKQLAPSPAPTTFFGVQR